MTQVSMAVNGRRVSADVEPRTHLADFLRETLLLTGTHIGCEHGVCGACTILLNDEPARSCLTFAALCDGADIRTVEALADDPLGVALRAAFTAEHALQCGYCTPGMLVTARDIVRRLPDADEDRIRLELAGNLCRCTGYNGIVRAIRRVMEAGVTEAVAPSRAVAAVSHPDAVPASVTDAAAPPDAVPASSLSGAVPAPVTGAGAVSAPVTGGFAAPGAVPAAKPGVPARTGVPRGDGLHPVLRIAQPVEAVWVSIQDPALIAACIPGARVVAIDGDRVSGEMQASLGPITARFAGQATLSFDQATRSGRVVGEGRDARGGTRLTGEAAFTAEPDGPSATVLRLAITYDLRGPLAQFSRGPVVEVFAAEIAAQVARNLDARLRGQAPPAAGGGLRLMLRVLWQTMKRWMKGSDG